MLPRNILMVAPMLVVGSFAQAGFLPLTRVGVIEAVNVFQALTQEVPTVTSDADSIATLAPWNSQVTAGAASATQVSTVAAGFDAELTANAPQAISTFGRTSASSMASLSFRLAGDTAIVLEGSATTEEQAYDQVATATVSLTGPGASFTFAAPFSDGLPTNTPFRFEQILPAGDYTLWLGVAAAGTMIESSFSILNASLTIVPEPAGVAATIAAGVLLLRRKVA